MFGGPLGRRVSRTDIPVSLRYGNNKARPQARPGSQEGLFREDRRNAGRYRHR